jgi:hypothetical protein
VVVAEDVARARKKLVELGHRTELVLGRRFGCIVDHAPQSLHHTHVLFLQLLARPLLFGIELALVVGAASRGGIILRAPLVAPTIDARGHLFQPLRTRAKRAQLVLVIGVGTEEAITVDGRWHVPFTFQRVP